MTAPFEVDGRDTSSDGESRGDDRKQMHAKNSTTLDERYMEIAKNLLRSSGQAVQASLLVLPSSLSEPGIASDLDRENAVKAHNKLAEEIWDFAERHAEDTDINEDELRADLGDALFYELPAHEAISLHICASRALPVPHNLLDKCHELAAKITEAARSRVDGNNPHLGELASDAVERQAQFYFDRSAPCIRKRVEEKKWPEYAPDIWKLANRATHALAARILGLPCSTLHRSNFNDPFNPSIHKAINSPKGGRAGPRKSVSRSVAPGIVVSTSTFVADQGASYCRLDSLLEVKERERKQFQLFARR